MKKILSAVFILVTAAACNNGKNEEKAATTDTTSIKSAAPDTLKTIEDKHYFWTAEVMQDGLKILKSEPAPDDSLSVPLMLEKLNAEHPDIKLAFKKIAADTVYLTIKNSSYLTSGIGDTGAMAYLGEITFNFTEVPGINYLNLAFRAGDHAEPGVYTRADFVEYTSVK